MSFKLAREGFCNGNELFIRFTSLPGELLLKLENKSIDEPAGPNTVIWQQAVLQVNYFGSKENVVVS